MDEGCDEGCQGSEAAEKVLEEDSVSIPRGGVPSKDRVQSRHAYVQKEEVKGVPREPLTLRGGVVLWLYRIAIWETRSETEWRFW